MAAVPGRRAVMGLIFFPRGGSAQVVRYLARSLPSAGWHPTIACGSLGPPGLQSNAATFFGGLDVRSVDYTAAAAAPDPLAADPPFHPSYEDRAGGPVLVYVGRYTEVKRIPLLIRAHARARERFARPAPLVLLGGFPGEWEGEHPLRVVRETGDDHVFLAGWRGHEDLPAGLNAADLLVLPSVREQFGQVLVEAMACGLPTIAVNAFGPAEIVDAGETGWLVPPDDEQAMADALVEAVNGDAERRRRGERAYEVAPPRYAWPALAHGLGHVYDEVVEGRPASAGAHTLTEA